MAFMLLNVCDKISLFFFFLSFDSTTQKTGELMNAPVQENEKYFRIITYSDV